MNGCKQLQSRTMRKLEFSMRLMVLVLTTLLLDGSYAKAQEPDLTRQARQALTTLFDALRSGDINQVDPLLAPEFQVVRSDGGAYDKRQYMKYSIPKIQKPPTFHDLVVTRNSEIVVARMRLQIEEQIDGKLAESGAPQLIVFRVTRRGWEVVAAANFARLMPPEQSR